MKLQALVCALAVAFAGSFWWPRSGQLAVLRGHTQEVFTLAFSRDGKTIAAGSGGFVPGEQAGTLREYGELKFWDVATGRERFTIDNPARFWSLAFSPDGKLLATGCGMAGLWAGKIKLWDVETGAELATVEQPWLVRSIAFSPDGARLATANYGSQANLWTLPELRDPIVLNGHGDHVNAVAFSPDGMMLATGSWDTTVRLWNAVTGRPVRTFRLEGEAAHVSSVAFSPDGSTLAAGSGGIQQGPQQIHGEVNLWDLPSGEKRATFLHDKSVTVIAFTPDGRTLASGSRDETVKLWDVATGRELTTIPHIGRINCVAFSPTGTILATASRDPERTIQLWRVETLIGKKRAETKRVFSN